MNNARSFRSSLLTLFRVWWAQTSTTLQRTAFLYAEHWSASVWSRRLSSSWWAQVDSNHRPRAYQARALTTWAMSPFSFRCISSLTLTFGGDDGNRTHDPLLAGQVLSQLSYTPIYYEVFIWMTLGHSKLNNKQRSYKHAVLVLLSPSFLVWSITNTSRQQHCCYFSCSP